MWGRSVHAVERSPSHLPLLCGGFSYKVTIAENNEKNALLLNVRATHRAGGRQINSLGMTYSIVEGAGKHFTIADGKARQTPAAATLRPRTTPFPEGKNPY